MGPLAPRSRHKARLHTDGEYDRGHADAKTADKAALAQALRHYMTAGEMTEDQVRDIFATVFTVFDADQEFGVPVDGTVPMSLAEINSRERLDRGRGGGVRTRAV